MIDDVGVAGHHPDDPVNSQLSAPPTAPRRSHRTAPNPTVTALRRQLCTRLRRRERLAARHRPLTGPDWTPAELQAWVHALQHLLAHIGADVMWTLPDEIREVLHG